MRLARFLPRFRDADRRIGELAQRENWSRSDIEAYQLERINALWRQSVTHVRYYRELRSQARLPHRFQSLADFQSTVPVLEKCTLRGRPDDFLSDRAERGRWRCTGGSTGVPMRVFWGHRCHREVLRARYRFYAMWGVGIFDRSAFLWGHEHHFGGGIPGAYGRLRQWLHDRMRNRLRLSAYHLSRPVLREYLRRMAAFRPVTLYGLTQAEYLLALEAAQIGFRCDSLRLIVQTGEAALPRMSEAIARSLGAPAVVEYGATECNFIAGQWPDGTLRVREDLVHLETEPRGDGSHGLLLTVLGNPAFPLIRYAIGDVTDVPLQRPDRGFAILQNIAGRNDDVLQTCRGGRLHPSAIDEIFEGGDTPVRRYRVHQRADGSVRVMLEPDGSADALPLHALRQRLEELLGGFPIEIAVVPQIPLTSAGKHRAITSEWVANESHGPLPVETTV